MFSQRVIKFLFAIILFLSNTKIFAAGLELDPEELKGSTNKKPVAVLQNRYFLKALRPELGLLVGSITNEAYTNSKIRGLRIGMFLNEWVGIETQYILTSVSNSPDRIALNKKIYRDREDPNKLVNADAEVNPINSMKDFVIIAAPLYGKMNILDLAIIYVDLYGSLGISSVETQQGTKSSIAFGGGQRFYFAQRWSSRLDFRNRSFVETRAGQSSRRNAWSMDLGLSYLFF